MSANTAKSFTFTSTKAQFLKHSSILKEKRRRTWLSWLEFIQLAVVFLGEIKEMKTIPELTFLSHYSEILADVMV